MTAMDVPRRQDVVGPDADPPHDQGRRFGSLLAGAAVVVALALALGIMIGWLVFDNDDARDVAGDRNERSVPAEVHQVVDQFMAVLETNDFALMQDVVTDDFRRPFYLGDADGSPWRDVYRIEAYKFMDDPNLSDADLVFWDIETVGDRIVRGIGPWQVLEVQNWSQPNIPGWVESVHTISVVERDGAYLVDDAYWAASPVLIVEE